MATGGFIGDHSVQWDVVADNVRQGSADGPVHEPRGGRGWHHRGIDETDDGQDQRFTVTVQRPKTGWPDETIAALQAFLTNRGAALSFRIPIEDRKYLERHGVNPPEPGPEPQIAVSWPSRSVTAA